MKVYIDEGGHRKLIGVADVPDDVGLLYEVQLFGASQTIFETYVIDVMGGGRTEGGRSAGEKVVVLSDGQVPDFLPGWRVLSS